MVKKHAIINIFILFFCLFSFGNTQAAEWIDYYGNENFVEFPVVKGPQKKTFGLDIKTDISKIQFYMKVQVTSDDDNPAPRICFSPDDQSCKSRQQLVKNPTGKVVVMWLKREEFNKEDQELYILVECATDECSYTIRFEGAQQPSFEPNFVYSYLVNSYNREMRFDVFGSAKDVFLTVSLDGSSKATLSVDNVYRDGVKYKSGTTLTYFLEDYGLKETNLASITVKNAEVGEYLTLTVHLVNCTVPNEGLGPNYFLEPNGPEITGYLEENVLNEECFPLDLTNIKYKNMNKLYITGRLHTKYGWFFLEDENRNYREETDVEIFDGQLSYVMTNNQRMNYICLELPSESAFKQYKMAYTISITAPNELASVYNYYPPQLAGDIYRRIIPKNSIAFFSGTKNDNTAKKYDYSIYQRKGLTKMYIADCRNYPDCHYKSSDFSNLIEPTTTNQMTIWTTTDDKSSAIGNEKYVIVASCEDDDNEKNGYCEFETSFISKGQDVYLIENEKFSKYLVKDEKGKFVIDLQSGRQIQRLTVDIMIFSGDVTFDCSNEFINGKLNEDIQISFDKYYLTNKVYFHINLAQLTTDKVFVNYKAELNSFFTIQFSVDSYNLVQLEELVPSGESYLVQIDPTSSSKTKNIHLTNRFYKNKNLFLANFFELNCEFEIKRGEEEIEFFDGYAQEVLDGSSEGYAADSYDYSIKIKEVDLSNYNHKMCMLYVAGYEDESQYAREIIVGENINQQIIFKDKLKKIRFLYPHADASKDLAVNINVIDKAFYKVNILANNENIKELTITRSQIVYLKGSVIMNKCETDKLCPIVVDVRFDSEIIKTEPMIEITIREILNTPTYLQKGQAKLDFVCGDRFYYLYTDIGKNELGEVTINFLREFGNIWGRVVRKDQTSVDEEANWRGIYRMPSEDWEDSLPIDKYTKKLLVSTEDTADCIEGCYLLLSVQVSQIGEYVEDYKFYPFSILTRITPNNKAYTDIPKVVIQVDEFVIGSVEVATNERIYEFFEVWLPHDSDTVEFDFQSSVAGLYINLGGTRPTTKNAHFKLLPKGKDTILKLTKTEILDKAKSLNIKPPKTGELEDINLVIGVWTDKTDSIDTELYSLRVHQPSSDSDNLDIIPINTDQKVMCSPTVLSTNEYRCLFVVLYDDEDVNMFTPLLAYGGSTNNGALSYMYANYIDRTIYDQYIKRDLNANIPTYQTTEDLNTKKAGVDYIYTNFLTKGKYMFINVMSDKPDPIMIVTNMPVYNYITYDLFEFYPNPTTEQLLSVPGEKLRLSFPGEDSIMVNLVTLYGQAEVSWKSDPDRTFILRGVGDRLSLSSGAKNDLLLIRRLLSDDKVNNNKLTMDDAGFVFYISYHKQNFQNNLAYEEINYGKSLELAFKDTDLPLVLYNKIGVEYRDINIAITFKDNEIENKGEHAFMPLLITAQLVKEKTIYEAKKDRDVSPSIERSVLGNYDHALKTAQVFLSEDKIKAYNVKESDNPSLYIKIDKMGDFADKTFEKFSVEAQISGVNDGVIPVEKVYHYGRVRNTVWLANYYRLRVDKGRLFMRIQIAFNSGNLDFAVSDTENQRRNVTFLHAEKARGKVYITLKVNPEKDLYYLYIFKKERTVSEEYLNNYAFKYINGKSESDFYDYPILESPEITTSENGEGENYEITCTFNKLDVDEKKVNVTYFFKVVENSTLIYGEEVNTIAVSESPYYVVYERNPTIKEGKITLTAKGDLSNWAYLNVIAQIQQNNVLEYISYNGKTFIRPSPYNDESGSDQNRQNNKVETDNTTMFVVVGVILIAIVIGLVITIFIFQQKNKNLLNQVKHVSFQQTNSNNNVDPNLLLQKSQQNA